MHDLDSKLAAALERVGHAMRVLLWEQAKAHKLSPMQVQLLLRVAHEPVPRRRVGALAAELDVKAPTVSDAVAALQRKGLVTTETLEGDRRGSRLELTDPGRTVVAALTDWQAPVTDRLATVPDAAKADALGLLVELMGHLRETGVISVARTCPTCRFFRRSPAAPHYCALLDAPLPLADLRVDCPEHEPLAA